MDDLFLFLDLETTGLDPKRCRIIEVACVLTGPDFVPIPGASYEALVKVTCDPTTPVWEHVAYQMHRASGLLNNMFTYDCLDSYGVNLDLHIFLSQFLGTKKANLAGNSVHFDRGFLVEHMPTILPFLTHRHLDVSSLRLAGMARGLPKFKGEAAHRAMADVQASLAELKYWIDALGARPATPAVAVQAEPST